MRTRASVPLLALAACGFLLSFGQASGHELPGSPQVRPLEVDPDPSDPLARFVTVEVLDPRGQARVPGAAVTASGRHALLGSALRTGPVRFAPGVEEGTYRGRLVFPRGGTWDLTIAVQGKYVGDAHFTVEIAAATEGRGPGSENADKPQLIIDRITVWHLIMEWGHLVGFGVWLAACALGLGVREGPRWPVLLLTWAAFALEGATGIYKMEYSTPFPGGLRLFALNRTPPIFFAREYVYTLALKHLLLVGAIGTTLILSIYVWRSNPGERSALFRALLLVNLVLALAIGAAAAILGFYHAIVLHFS